MIFSWIILVIVEVAAGRAAQDVWSRRDLDNSYPAYADYFELNDLSINAREARCALEGRDS